MLVIPGYYETKKKEIGMGSKLREKTTTGNHRVARGSLDTAVQEGISMDDPMRDKLNAVNTPVMVEDVMDVAHKEAAIGENPKKIKLGRKAKNQGDYFNEKISEIDSELRKFELEKDSTYDLVLIVETDITQDGKSENCGIMPNKSHHELAAWEDLNVQGQHVTNTEGNPFDYVPHVIGKKKRKSQENTHGEAANTNSTWKRIVRKETKILPVVPPLKTLKRTCTTLFDSELPKKKKQVSHDDQDNTIELAGSVFQPY